MDVHQISVQFVAAEDRLLLRVSTREGEMVSAWLTRRLMRGLWSPFDRLLAHVQVSRDRPQAIVHPEARDMLAQASRRETLGKIDLETEFQAGTVLPELGDAPLLVTEVKLSPKAGGQVGSVWLDAQGHELTLDLDPTAATALQEMLSRAIKQADWRLGVQSATETDSHAAQPEARLLN
ncbi:MAG TPA: hypothetical protein VLA16_26690 [Ideonella sp.]|nr:hypothetical protein [Ideonella sp.]